MRTITADWSLPQRKNGNWISNMRAKLQRAGQRAVAREARAHDPLVQADAAAFVSAFMRIG
jgi:hypothetical protein